MKMERCRVDLSAVAYECVQGEWMRKHTLVEQVALALKNVELSPFARRYGAHGVMAGLEMKGMANVISEQVVQHMREDNSALEWVTVAQFALDEAWHEMKTASQQNEVGNAESILTHLRKCLELREDEHVE